MTNYELGIAALSGIQPKAPRQLPTGIAGWDAFTLLTPDRIRSRAADLDSAWQQLARYASAAPELAGWNSFYARIKAASWYDLGNAAAQDLDSWTARYENARRVAGSTTAPPGPTIGPSAEPPKPPGSGSFLRPVGIGVATGLTLAGIFWAVARFRSP